MLKPTRILLVDDHRLLRAGLCSLLNSLSGIEVIAQADNGREAIRLANTHQPDLVIMDIAGRTQWTGCNHPAEKGLSSPTRPDPVNA